MAPSITDSHPRMLKFEFGREDWFWKQRDLSIQSVLDELALAQHDDHRQGWKKTIAFPSEIHVELLKTSAIPDPYVGFNEHKVQWVGDEEWLYKCDFTVNLSTSNRYAELIFEGLDTICDVYLNDDRIMTTSNMFRTYTYEISLHHKHPLRTDNTLLLHFKSAKSLAKLEEAKYGRVRAGSTNLGDPSRVYVRKAQYDWRWDWGPELMTCGPYRPIAMLTYDVRIAGIHVRNAVDFQSDDAFIAKLKLDVTLKGALDASGHVLLVTLFDKRRHAIKSERVQFKGQEVSPRDSMIQTSKQNSVVSWENLETDGIQLWWPVGYGMQTLYTVEVSLLDKNNEIVDQVFKRIGFRAVRLIQESLSESDHTGTTFLFEINNVRMFMGGSNWIPADNFLTQVSAERYRNWLTLLRDGNQNMVRIWGGGIYEPDVFYDICDELGILVWQDFQFACGVYPAHEEFVINVKQEAIDNVTRLRHHPSIICFCGNNEDYQLVLQWGDVAQLPARVLYEDILPEIVATLTDPAIPYHRGSPYGGKGWDTSDPTVGDVHQWNIWGGKELPYQEYDRMGGRFVSEFGIPSMPSMLTINYWMKGAEETQFYSQSQLMAQHTKAGSFERRFAIVMNENFRLTSDFEAHVFNTQLMQSEAISFAYRSWRRLWRGRGREYTAGVLVWQLNDCWPGVSWAIADYFLRPKPVYYTIARELAPITVGIFRNVMKNRENDRPRQFYEFGAIQTRGAILSFWTTNSALMSKRAKLEINFFDLLSPAWSHSETYDVELLPNQSVELLELVCPGPRRDDVVNGEPLSVISANVVIGARLLDVETGHVLARQSNWPEPYRFLQAPDPGLKIDLARGTSDDETILTVSVDRPAKCVFLSVEDPGPEVKWSDNALDLVPQDEQVVVAKGLNGRKIQVAYFGREKAQYI